MQSILLRAFDILLSLTGIILGLPAMIAIYFIGLFDTGRPLFFQKRVGKNQKYFTLVKFRTMSITASSVATHEADTALITRLGTWLRKTKLDELPQLFNVLLGQMSLVGPRPCLPSQLELIEERGKRGAFSVRPGITGLAQVNEVDMSTPRKLARYDKIMIENMNVGLFFRLITITALGKGSGDRVRIAKTIA